MSPWRSRPARSVALAFLAGGAHAAVVAVVVDRLDQPLDPLAAAPGGTVGALLGLLVLLALPTYLAVRRHLAGPLAVVVGTGGWALLREWTTPAPEFSSLHGHLVVRGPRYVAGYVDAWYVWLLAALLVGLAEHVARTDWERLPTPAGGRLDDVLGRDAAVGRLAVAVAASHAVVLLALAADAGYFEPGAYLPAPWYVGLGVLAWTVVGLVAVGGVTGLLLARWRLVVPTLALAWLVWTTGWTQQQPLPDDPLPVYFLGWWAFAGVLVGLGVVEAGVRRAWRRRAPNGAS